MEQHVAWRVVKTNGSKMHISPVLSSVLDHDLQRGSYYFTGWKHLALVSSVLAWSPDGLIRWAAVNYPGSWHDAFVSSPLVTSLLDEGLKSIYVIASFYKDIPP